jgi:hypothetical protein
MRSDGTRQNAVFIDALRAVLRLDPLYESVSQRNARMPAELRHVVGIWPDFADNDGHLAAMNFHPGTRVPTPGRRACR